MSYRKDVYFKEKMIKSQRKLSHTAKREKANEITMKHKMINRKKASKHRSILILTINTNESGSYTQI